MSRPTKSYFSLVQEFYEEIREEHPFLSLQDLKLIINTPWQMLKDSMNSDTYIDVRFKYLGIFKVIKRKRNENKDKTN